MAFIGWCAAETPNQQAEAIVEVLTIGAGGQGFAPLPRWLMEAAHPTRPQWHVVSAWAPSGAAVSAHLFAYDGPEKDGASLVASRASDPITGEPVSVLVLVRVRCSTTASLKPWQEERDPTRRAASVAFHSSTRRHDRRS